MVAHTHGSVTLGVQAHIIDVEADVSAGLPGFTMVGLADTAVNEARERVKSAMTNSGVSWPKTRVTIALLPASWRKRGSGLDLAIAAAILAESGVVPGAAVAQSVFVGELGLDGSVRPVTGVIATTLAARDAGYQRVLVPVANAAEAALVPGVSVGAIRDLAQLVQVLTGRTPLPDPPASTESKPGPPLADLADVRGQLEARRALEIAAAGGHHLSMMGTPGVGKTLIAERLPGILPPLTDAAALQATAIASIAGLADGCGLQRRPPFQAPHHTASKASIIGGGRGSQVRMGAVTLAHHGVLFLDEAAEFDHDVLNAMRQPLEGGVIRLHRADFAVVLPAKFHLVIAANPCPCGYGIGRGSSCSCSALQRRRYAIKLSGPLMDRIDLRLTMTRPSVADLRTEGESSAVVSQRVLAARDRSTHRWREFSNEDGDSVGLNAAMPSAALRRHFPPSDQGAQDLMRALDRGLLTLRGADRVLRVAWTLADLNERGQPSRHDIGFAMSLRATEGEWAA